MNEAGFFSTPKAANDNFTEGELRRAEQAVVAFSGETKEIPEEMHLDGSKVTSIRGLLAELAGSPLLRSEIVDGFRKEYGTPTSKQIISHIAQSTPDDWKRQPAFFAYLLQSLDGGLSEIADD